MDNKVLLGASILTADFLNLGDELERAESAGIDFFHMDVMDGRFVPNITIGPVVIEAVRKKTSLPIDVHLMIDEPERFIVDYIRAGADSITVHVEACDHLHAALLSMKRHDVEPGVTLNPATPLIALEELLPLVGQVLIMSVNPGFGGQTFIPGALKRISRARQMIDDGAYACRLEVDGGLKRSNIGKVVAAGADALVVGSGIFNPDQSVADAIGKLREAIRAADGSAESIPVSVRTSRAS